MFKIVVIGHGRIGKIHVSNIQQMKDAQVASIITSKGVFFDEKDRVSIEHILPDPEIDAVVVCCSTESSVGYIKLALEFNKHVFCEKPVSNSIEQLFKIKQLANKSSCHLMVGFNRRFDASFIRLKEAIVKKEIGELEVLRITSMDPDLPSLDYLKTSNGIFHDMMIHDFDMINWLTESTVANVNVTGRRIVNDNLGDSKDFDTILLNADTTSGVLCQVLCRRQSSYGYEQTIEAYGNNGAIVAENQSSDSTVLKTSQGIHRSPIPYFFEERYQQSYVTELQSFVQSIQRGQSLKPSIDDAIAACSFANTVHRNFLTKTQEG